MFGRRFAYQYQDGGDEGWTPPWLQKEGKWQGPQNFGMHRGHAPFGHHGPFGHWRPFGPGGERPRFFEMHRGRGPFGHRGPFGPGGEGPRFFGRGDMKFALLGLLQERPMYGYEMIKALEEKSGGFYTPSPGSIYPTLQMLEDRGFVSVKDVEGKKVYSITETGRTLLSERQQNEEEFTGPPWMRQRGFGRQHRFAPEMQALKSEAMEVARLLTIAGRMSFQDPEQLTRLRSIIERTRKDLTDMIYAVGSQQGQPSSQTDRPSVEEV
ncbi:MAG: hypothetical protein NVSMB33_16730 [Ktedonobacteraceae bacterium]